MFWQPTVVFGNSHGFWLVKKKPYKNDVVILTLIQLLLQSRSRFVNLRWGFNTKVETEIYTFEQLIKNLNQGVFWFDSILVSLKLFL